ncbi:MAG: hypothetical protein K8R52_04335 [Bacteroidales bacterium]|nr:hypothetical protein [Bacteroidales bacterium]
MLANINVLGLHRAVILIVTLFGIGAAYITMILFAVSAFTPKTDPGKLEKTTINYSNRIAKFSGLSDWRLHLLILSIITILLYIWLR